MKNLRALSVATAALFILAHVSSFAQGNVTASTPTITTVKGDTATKKIDSNFFLGKWDVLMIGIPGGDAHSTLVFEMKKDSVTQRDTLVGHIEKSAIADEIPLTKIEPSDTTITFYFSAQGYDLNMFLDKKGADNAEGKLYDRFDAKAVRIKQKD